MKSEVQDILKKWEAQIDTCLEQLHPQVRKFREQIKRETVVTIWLGGPGRDHKLFFLRNLVGELLKKDNFKIFFSEDFLGGGDLASKEIEEVEALDLTIILSITPGASAEAIEFAYLPHIRHKLWVYFPEEYKNGYVFRSLFGRHRLIAADSLFSLKNFEQYDSELAVKIWNRATSCRNNLYRKKKMEKLLG